MNDEQQREYQEWKHQLDKDQEWNDILPDCDPYMDLPTVFDEEEK